MIISPGRRYIFVHIPKTGGTALALALEDRAKADDILIGDTPKAKRRRKRLKALTPAGRLWKHSKLADIEGIVSSDELASSFVFTLVRNPWDRMVSYYHWLRDQNFDHSAVARAKATDFSSFLNDPTIQRSVRGNPYSSYLTDAQGCEHANCYVRLEHLEQDLVPVWTHLGFNLDVPRVNASARERDWRPYYSDRNAEVLRSICAVDIEKFGYEFDPGSPQT